MTEFIKWQDSYSVGYIALDKHHKSIIETINRLYQIVKGELNEELYKPMIYRLKGYTDFHFDFEENLMKKAGYPQLDNHQKLHKELALKTLSLNDSIIENYNQVPKDLLPFLKEWWLNHILKADFSYKPYILKIEN